MLKIRVAVGSFAVMQQFTTIYSSIILYLCGFVNEYGVTFVCGDQLFLHKKASRRTDGVDSEGKRVYNMCNEAKRSSYGIKGL